MQSMNEYHAIARDLLNDGYMGTRVKGNTDDSVPNTG